MYINTVSIISKMYFCRASSYASAVLAVVILSVRPSLRHTRALCQNQAMHCGSLIPHERAITPQSTLCLKKVPTFKLSVTLSNINRFSNFLHCWKAYEIFYKTHQHCPPHLGTLLHYLGKLKIQIFCRYSANMEESANKLHFYRF